jgi:hypothetical protein
MRFWALAGLFWTPPVFVTRKHFELKTLVLAAGLFGSSIFALVFYR